MSASAEMLCVDPARVADLWPYSRALILAAIRRTGLSHTRDVEASILAGRSLLWITWNGETIAAAAATRIIANDAGKVCIIEACGGRGRWPVLIRKIEIYAAAEGCSAVRIYGRRGWARVLKTYAVEHVVLERLL